MHASCVGTLQHVPYWELVGDDEGSNDGDMSASCVGGLLLKPCRLVGSWEAVKDGFDEGALLATLVGE